MEKYKRKKETIIIKITKKDAFYMREHGYEECVKRSKSKHPTYYLVEEESTYRYDKKSHRRYIVHKGALHFYNEYRKSLLR